MDKRIIESHIWARKATGFLTNPPNEIQIKNEPMLFNCNLDAAITYGGELTKGFLDSLPKVWKEGPVVIDSRVHMLMKGWYPCIPGWHHDDVPRTLPNGQPNYDDSLRSEHVMMLLNAEICATEFAEGTAVFSDPEERIYAQWNQEVDAKILQNEMRIITAQSGVLYFFSDRTFHRGVKAVGNGWRFFIRASVYFKDGRRVDRPNPRTNEVRKQVQVYLDTVNEGW